MNQPYLYQTFKRFKPDGSRPDYWMVIHILIKEGTRIMLTLLNLDGSLNIREITPKEFSDKLDKKELQEWKP